MDVAVLLETNLDSAENKNSNRSALRRPQTCRKIYADENAMKFIGRVPAESDDGKVVCDYDDAGVEESWSGRRRSVLDSDPNRGIRKIDRV